MRVITFLTLCLACLQFFASNVSSQSYKDAQVQQSDAYGPEIQRSQYGRDVSVVPVFQNDSGYYGDSIIQKNKAYRPGVHMAQHGSAVALELSGTLGSPSEPGSGSGLQGFAGFLFEVTEDKEGEEGLRKRKNAQNWIYNYSIASSDEERALRRKQLINVVNTPYLVDECRRVANEIDDEHFKTYANNLFTAAKRGDSEAEMIVGYNYATGSNGFEKNINSSYPWLIRAAKQGNKEAIDMLGYFSEIGYGIEENLESALYFYNKGVVLGSPFAQSRLGSMYFEGRGVEKNEEQAVRLHTMASEQGMEESMTFLDSHKGQ